MQFDEVCVLKSVACTTFCAVLAHLNEWVETVPQESGVNWPLGLNE